MRPSPEARDLLEEGEESLRRFFARRPWWLDYVIAFLLILLLSWVDRNASAAEVRAARQAAVDASEQARMARASCGTPDAESHTLHLVRGAP